MLTSKSDLSEKDKILAKETALVVADEVVSQIPGLGMAWNLSKALFGSGLKLRQKKALEWVEMVRDNPGAFSQELLGTEEFQDGFAFALEKYLIERNKERRGIFRNIFLGFAQAEAKEGFPLEKFIHTLSQLSELAIVVLGDVDVKKEGKNYQIYGNNPKRLENIYNLINLGLLLEVTGSRIGPVNAPFVKLSIFGKEFINYLKKSNNGHATRRVE